MTHKKKAEAYVRSKCPELMELSFGCEIEADHDTEGNGSDSWVTIRGIVLGDGFYGSSVEVHTEQLVSDDYKNVTVDVPKSNIRKIIGHPIQLHHWLRPIYLSLDNRADYIHFSEATMKVYYAGDLEINFSLLTGQPATDADYQAFNKIVGVN